MPSTRVISYYAMYIIGEVESHWNWQAVNRGDPITVGMMQWYGTRAAGLLTRIKSELPDQYGVLSASLRSLLDSHAPSDGFWNSFYLNDEQANSVVACFEPRENHIVQENQAIEDFRGYISTLEGWGFSQINPKPLIFAMSMYHQSPASAGRVVQTAGGSATLDRIYEVCRNDRVLGAYQNRYNTVYQRLKDWDGESMPPDFGQDGGAIGEGGQPPSTNQTSNQLRYIIQRGDNLVLFGEAPFNNGVVFYKTSAQTWTVAKNFNGTPITGGNTGGGSATQAQAAVDLYLSWVGRFAYSQGPGRLTPLESGYGDCSSTIWAAYHDSMGIDVGTWTGAMAGKGRLIVSGTNGSLPINQMAAGDLVIVWRGYRESQHVEMYIGNNQLCGHGGPGNGPTIKQNASAYVSSQGYWEVRRYA